MYPFGYVALLPLIGLVTIRRTTARQVDALVDNLGFVLAASSVDGIPSPNFAPRDPLPVLPPPMPAPIPVPVTASLPRHSRRRPRTPRGHPERCSIPCWLVVT